jgi:photosystem II stability/assembly factor-like uncharacterized protein
MLPEDPDELFIDDGGETWNRIIINDANGNHIATVRTLNDTFREQLEGKYGYLIITYSGGSLHGVTI